MCEVDCLQCVNDMCVCAANYGGFGEGVNLNGCHLNQRVIGMLWEVAFGIPIVVICVCLLLLARWLRRGGIDWMKLFSNRNFRLLCGSANISFWFMLLAAVRVFGSSYAFNDVAATIFFNLAHMSLFIQCVPLIDLCHDTLVSLLVALGVKEGLPKRGPWVRGAYYALGLIYIPVFASPALDFAGRKIMVQYSLIAMAVLAMAQVLSMCVVGEKAIKVLASIGTEPTVLPRRRIRVLLINFYFTGVACVVGHAIIARYATYYPFFLPSLVIAMCPACLAPVLGLSYDPSRISVDPRTKPGVTGSSRRPMQDESSSASKPSPPIVCCVEQPPVEMKTPDLPNRELEKEPGGKKDTDYLELS